MKSPSILKTIYPGKTRERYNKAIRAEIPGGPELLDLMELVHQVRSRGRVENPLLFLTTLEDHLQGIRDAYVASIRAAYGVQGSDDSAL